MRYFSADLLLIMKGYFLEKKERWEEVFQGKFGKVINIKYSLGLSYSPER